MCIKVISLLRLFSCMFICLVANILFGQQLPLKFEHLTSENGLSNSSSEVIFQDSKGFLWIGTWDGLNKYDGYQITVYKNKSGDNTSISNNSIQAITEDKYGRLWIGTRDGLNLYNRALDRFRQFKPQADNPNSISNNSINGLYVDSKGFLWIGTYYGLCVLDLSVKDQFIFKNYLHSNTDTTTISDNVISTIAEDSNSNIWISNNSEYLDCLASGNKNFKHIKIPIVDIEKLRGTTKRFVIDSDNDFYIIVHNEAFIYWDRLIDKWYRFRHNPKDLNSISDSKVRNIYLDSENKCWIATDGGGLNLFNKKDLTFQYCMVNLAEPYSISSNAVYSIFKDRSGVLWTGTYNAGINKVAINRSQFGAYFPGYQNSNSLSYKLVKASIEDSKGNIWIGTDGGGLNLFDPKTGNFKCFKHDPNSSKSISGNSINSICEDSEGFIWVGTWKKGLNRFDPATQQVKRYNKIQGNPHSLADDVIWSILEDHQKRLWIGTDAGLNLYDPKTDQFRLIEKESGGTSLGISCLFEDNQHRLWNGSQGGVDVLNLDQIKPGKPLPKLVPYKYVQSNGNSNISVYQVKVIFQDRKDNLWFGTESGVTIYDQAKKDFNQLTVESGLAGNFINGILEDGSGNIWLSTNRGISKYDPAKKTFKNYDQSDGLQGNEFIGNGLKLRNGQFLFGGINGFNLFDPDEIKINAIIPNVVITNFKLFNETVHAGDLLNGRMLLPQTIGETNTVKLNYNENFFSFEFSSLDFWNPEKNQYAYQLEGFDKDWNYANNKHDANYTNVNPGKYVFTVKSSNSDGVWNETGVSVEVIVRPPFWKTWWAYSLYVIISSAIMLVIRFYLLSRERLKNIAEIEHIKAEKEREMSELKMKFFTHISHEFRTPLTLISSPLNKLINYGKYLEWNKIQQYFQIMQRNTQLLERLTNQLLDVRKIETGNMKFEPAFGNIFDFIHEIALSFEPIAQRKNIHYEITPDSGNIDAWFDPDKLEKIINNLLSNAFKFTPENRKVMIEIQERTRPENIQEKNHSAFELQNKHFMELKVSDSGIGISATQLPYIFDQFYQANTAYSSSSSGTGIGLALTKELVNLHNGEILVESNPETGTTFTVRLPISRILNEKEKEFKTSKFDLKMEYETSFHVFQIENSTNEIKDSIEKKASILIIEDNPDLRFYLADLLSDSFSVLLAENGQEGIEKARESMPALIVSDVMMPKMDGLQLVKELKSNLKTSHIPIILLTALSSVNSKITGWEMGADDYITKPFNDELVIARVNNLLENRKLLQQRFRKELSIEPKDYTPSSADEKLLDKLLAIIEKNMENSDFSVDDLITELGTMSRAQFYRKITSLVGQSPNDFIITIRLKRGAQLLKTKQYTVSEVAYKVGFNHPRRFSEKFREQFGMLPSEYTSLN